jgi:hypothetical protein
VFFLPAQNNNTNTQKQLIPGLWFEKVLGNKSSIRLSVNPFVMHTNSRIVIENKIQKIGKLASNLQNLDSTWFKYDSTGYHIDTSIQVNRVVTILQSFGYRVALDYNYKLLKKWKFTVGLEYNHIFSMYLNDNIIRARDGFVAKDAIAYYKSGNEFWSLINHSYLCGSTSISYFPVSRFSISVGYHKSFKSISRNINQEITSSPYFLNFRMWIWHSKK